MKTEPGSTDGPSLALSQAHVASALPPHEWNTKCTHIAWTVKFHPAKGLTPVRPQVLLRRTLTVKARSAVQLS